MGKKEIAIVTVEDMDGATPRNIRGLCLESISKNDKIEEIYDAKQ